MYLNLDFKFKALDGLEIAGQNAAKLVADQLASRAEGISAVKAYDWALKLHNDGGIEVDRADSESLEKIIESSQLFNLAKAQVILVIKAARDAEK